jgi:hypothetical protein
MPPIGAKESGYPQVNEGQNGLVHKTMSAYHIKKKLHGFSPLANYTDRSPPVSEASANFSG